MAFILQKVIKYRVRVTRANLKLAFPDLPCENLLTLEKAIYRNLADISVEALKGFTMPNKNVMKRHKILNPELLDFYHKNGQSVIGVAGHIGNWEWGAISAGVQLNHYPIAIYKSLSNKLIDGFMKWNRSLRGTLMAPTSITFETFEKYRNTKCIYLLVADQSPSKSSSPKAYWIDFFNMETACIHGPEKYARMYNYPIIFIDIRRVKRGFYEIELSTLVDNPNEIPDGDITKRYMNKLEEVIRRNPESWLWSHRRWKLKRL